MKSWKEPPDPDKPAPDPTLRERAYALRFDPEDVPPPDEVCMTLGEISIAARGNLTVVQGKSKVGKSAVVGSVIGAAHRGNFAVKGDTLCMEWKGEAKGAILHLDTEQSRSDWHTLVRLGLKRSGLPKMDDRLVSLPMIMFGRSDRLEILKQSLAHEKERLGCVDFVIIDGVADLCASPNDEEEALQLVSDLMALAQQYHCAILCVIHENPGTAEGKTRGHLGSELNRKAFGNLRIDKDSETLVSTIYGIDMRKRDIPKDHGFCFAWNEAAGMHTYKGRAAGLKAAMKEADAREKAWAIWEPIFAAAPEAKRTNGECPVLSAADAVAIESDIKGTPKKTGVDAMRHRMERAEILGVLRKEGRGGWILGENRTSGHDSDK